jgi:hypothetical protein
LNRKRKSNQVLHAAGALWIPPLIARVVHSVLSMGPEDGDLDRLV